MKTILCYGDSNTYGYDPRNGGRYPREVRWTTILQNILGSEYEVISEGLNGRTTAYDREDGAWKNGYPYLQPCIGTHKPVDEIVIMLGTNDCNSDLHLSAEDIARGLEKLIKIVKDETEEMQGFVPEILIVVPAAIKSNYMNSPFVYQLDADSVKKSHDIAPLYKTLAAEYGCKYLDASESAEVSDIDSEHLTIEGHKTLAQMIAQAL